MYYEPDTIWGRTVAGDREVVAARSGLSLGQRRLLTLLTHPRTFATLAARRQMDVFKLEHELVRLAQLRLVAFQRPGSPQPRTAPGIDLPFHAQAVPQGTSRQPPLPVCAAAVALGIAAVLLMTT